jgi:hypothetical protein
MVNIVMVEKKALCLTIFHISLQTVENNPTTLESASGMNMTALLRDKHLTHKSSTGANTQRGPSTPYTLLAQFALSVTTTAPVTTIPLQRKNTSCYNFLRSTKLSNSRAEATTPNLHEI